jgi:hypothetical protein
MADWVMMDRGCGHKEEVRLSVGWYRAQAERKAFYASACPTCGYVKPSEDAPEPARSVAPQATAAPSPGPSSVRTAVGPGIYTQVRTNKHPGRCRCCGRMVPAGKGRLYYIDPDEAYEESGWIVECLDGDACREYQETRTIYHK